MAMHQTSVDVEVPVRDAYNQWTQFETFPEFMDGVEKITQTDATHTHWTIQHRRRHPGVRRRDHRADPRPAGGLEEHRRHRPTAAS